MTTEPRQEAEQHLWDRVTGVSEPHKLTDFLAAAIKYNDARKRGKPTLATEQAERELDGALSALREEKT